MYCYNDCLGKYLAKRTLFELEYRDFEPFVSAKKHKNSIKTQAQPTLQTGVGRME